MKERGLGAWKWTVMYDDIHRQFIGDASRYVRINVCDLLVRSLTVLHSI